MAFKVISKIKVPLANAESAVAGYPACIDRAAGASQGKAVAAAVSTDLIPIGRFCESMTGDGTTTVEIELFSPKRVQFFVNDGSPNTVDATDLLGPCYWTADNEVGVPADPSTYSMAGRVWIVEGASGARVGIETADSIGLTGPQGEPGA